MKFVILILFILIQGALANIGPSFTQKETWKKSKEWSEVVKLQSEQKYKAALNLVNKKLKDFIDDKDEKNWTRALFLKQQLTVGLHKAETSVQEFKSAKWPDSISSQVVLHLYYAQTLKYYYHTYSWEINQREQVDTKKKLDLKKWSKEDITKEIYETLSKIWDLREKLKDTSSEELSEFIYKGSYPQEVRGTIRDALTYFYVEFLQDSQFWTAKHSNEKKMLTLKQLLEPEDKLSLSKTLKDMNIHPLLKVVGVLKDLEKWHWSKDRISALIEAKLEKYRIVSQQFKDEDEIKKLIKSLDNSLVDYQIDPWWAEAMYFKANQTVRLTYDDAIIDAIKIAEEAAVAHPKSIGAKRCDAYAKRLKSPILKMFTSTHDFANKRSIVVTHKNWDKIYFRAYKFQPVKYLLSKQKNRSLPGWDDLEKILEDTKIEYEWGQELENRKDFREHKTFVNIPVKENGYYVIVASGKKDFKDEQNYKIANYINITDLRLIKEQIQEKYKLQVRNAHNGKPVKAKIHVYQEDWKKGHKLYNTYNTDKQGIVILDDKKLDDSKSYYLVAETDKDKFFDLRRFYQQSRYSGSTFHSNLVLTDRAVYRPGQTVHFKVLSFENRTNKNEMPMAKPKTDVLVELHDSNWKVVESIKLKTNEFATASGSFKIPSGRALGAWSVGTGNHRQTIRVEEYKRPTFTSSLLNTKKPAKLNSKVSVEGEAKYYYGLPVKDAKVSWTVTRKAQYPYWYHWWWGGLIDTNPQIIASGTSQSDKNGKYIINFIPKAALKEVENGVKYNYAISANVLDAGGETATAEKVFVLGKYAAEAKINKMDEYLSNGMEAMFEVTRSDLNGKPLTGTGNYELYKLEEPKKTLLPADQPKYYLRDKKVESKYATEGDKIRPRLEPLLNENYILKSFKNGKKVKSGKISHGKEGLGKLALGKLPAGSYRLVYTTKDAFGSLVKAEEEFFVINKKSSLKLPLLLVSKQSTAHVGETVRFFVHSGYTDAELTFEILQDKKVILTKSLNNKSDKYINFKIKNAHLGGITARVYTVVDHILISKSLHVNVPYVHKKLDIDVSRIRKQIYPGTNQEWTIKISARNSKDNEIKLKQQAEVLAFMYDKSLDVFAPYNITNLDGHFPRRFYNYRIESWLTMAQSVTFKNNLSPGYSLYYLSPDRLIIENSIGIGGPGMRGSKGGMMAFGMSGRMDMESAAPAPMAKSSIRKKVSAKKKEMQKSDDLAEAEEVQADSNVNVQPKDQIRSNFSETAFFKPHLLTDKNGNVKIQFTAPDSLTAWNFWAHAITKDLSFGTQKYQIESVKDLMVRAYLPRFFRQGDKLSLKIVVTNAGKQDLAGKFHFEISLNNVEATKNFKLQDKFIKGLDFKLKAGESQDFSVPLEIPSQLGTVKIKTYAKTKQFTDGEEKQLQLLPSRTYLAQSKFVTLTNKEKRVMEFKDMSDGDKTRINDSLVVKIDSQLFYSILSALPYLVHYPYECTEQTLNRFLTSSILGETYKKYPSVEKMAQKLKKRNTQFESFNKDDPNRKMALEETPWLNIAEGGRTENLLNMLDPKVVKAQRESSIQKLNDAQTASGGFPWFAGGPPSFYITTYIIYGLAKAQEFGVSIPKRMTIKAWQYVKDEYQKMVDDCMKHNSCYEMITLINFVASSFKDEEYLGGAFPKSERLKMLEYSFKHWKKISPQIKAMLALTLKRMDRKKDAILVFDSIMDSSETKKDLGTFWAPEDRSWLWYNDTIETHAYILRALIELKPKDKIRHGLVQWLFLNKKLNHWKSTKATAEVMYSVLHYLNQENLIDIQQEVKVKMGAIEKQFLFKPDEYTGKDNFVVAKGKEVDEKTMQKIEVEQTSKGMSFASATWHYSTEKLPTEARGDFFEVKRSFYKRWIKDGKVQLTPLKEGAEINVGDEVEIQLSIRSKHKAEYVQLRDPRPAGFEPATNKSSYKWDLGLIRFQEVRDSGMNFFMEYIPVGEYTLKHRIRANMAGEFRVNPATIQSIYAPEFRAFSSGIKITVKN